MAEHRSDTPAVYRAVLLAAALLATRLHPALIAVGVVVVGQLFGFVGLFVAVPIISLFLITIEELWVKRIEQAAAEP